MSLSKEKNLQDTTTREQKQMKIQAQVLYNLRELSGFWSGKELQNFFGESLGDPSPEGSVNVSVPQEAVAYLKKRGCSILEKNEKGRWYEAENHLTIQEATNFLRDFSEDAIIVPMKAVSFMEERHKSECTFEGGFVIFKGNSLTEARL